MTLAYIIQSSIEQAAIVAGGGCAFYFLKGVWRNDAEGGEDDYAAGARAVFENQSGICRCTAWSGVVSAIDLGLQHVRQVDDPLNLMVAWGASNALFSVHRGPRAAVREGLKGATYGGAVSVALFALLHFACCSEEKSSA